MKVTTPAFSVEGELLPETEYDIVSAFNCDFHQEDGQHIVRGFWARLDDCAVEPIYLTQIQLDAIAASGAA